MSTVKPRILLIKRFVETVYVKYDSEVASLKKIPKLYYDVIDPLSVNRQGSDMGRQYCTGIYYTNFDDLIIIEKSIIELQKKFNKSITIEVKPLKNYYKAEEFH